MKQGSIHTALGVLAMLVGCGSTTGPVVPGAPQVAGMSGAAAGNAGASASSAGKPGVAGSGGAPSAGRDAPDDDAGSGGADSGPSEDLARFSFFVSSLRAMRELSGSQDGFGGDLRFGETGDGAGLRGADKICTTIAEQSLPGSGAKQWRAFLSTTAGGANGGPVHAIDRVGNGPWYDRRERLVATDKADLMQTRPASADPEIKNDLPNEDGVPNHNPDGVEEVDNHDVLTGTGADGHLYKDDPRVTCDDWTKSEGDSNDAPRVGHSWPRGDGGRGGRPRGDGGPRGGGSQGSAGQGGGSQGGGRPGGGSPGGGEHDDANWMSALDEAGCGAGVSIVEMGPPIEAIPTVGSGGGYGAIYCFALSP